MFMPQDLKAFGLIPEIIGRLPVLTYHEAARPRSACARSSSEPKNSIVKQYVPNSSRWTASNSPSTDGALDYIVDRAIVYKLGARGLRSICEAVMMDTMFDIPSSGCKEFRVTLPYAKEKIEKANFVELKKVG